MIAIIVILAIVVIIALWAVSAYNNFIKGKNIIEEAFSTMDVYLKKRFDLIPNLVETVKGYAKHESETLTAVTKLRTSIASASNEDDRMQAEAGMTKALGRLLAVAESYPNLKANENFKELQKELTVIEDDIASSRKYYNGAVRKFNTSVESFPSVFIARAFGFEKYKMYEVDNASERENVIVEF